MTVLLILAGVVLVMALVMPSALKHIARQLLSWIGHAVGYLLCVLASAVVLGGLFSGHIKLIHMVWVIGVVLVCTLVFRGIARAQEEANERILSGERRK